MCALEADCFRSACILRFCCWFLFDRTMKSQKQAEAAALSTATQRGCLSPCLKGLPECPLEVQAGNKANGELKHELSVSQYRKCERLFNKVCQTAMCKQALLSNCKIDSSFLSAILDGMSFLLVTCLLQCCHCGSHTSKGEQCYRCTQSLPQWDRPISTSILCLAKLGYLILLSRSSQNKLNAKQGEFPFSIPLEVIFSL